MWRWGHATDLLHPIILCEDRRVMGGRHWVVKARLQGQSHIMPVCFPETPAPHPLGIDPDDLPYDDAQQFIQAEAASQFGLIQSLGA